MADSAILAAGGADAPLSYVVPGSAVITIKQIHVKYVDNGAGGDWLPAVRIVNDAGHTMGTAADQGVKVTAGSDADTSFFPGVKHAAAATGASLDVAYYEILGVSSGSFPGTVFYDMQFAGQPSNPAVFDLSGGYAKILQPGAYWAEAFIDFQTTETFTAGGITVFRFGLDFPAFPFYTVGGPWMTLNASPTAKVFDAAFQGEFIVSTTPKSCRLFVRGPAVAPAPSPIGFLVLHRLRPFDWVF
jgi:hypothetical protein